jgi:two-component system, OmpR family, alkaline phosphatase synthesis response regulator PhoP
MAMKKVLVAETSPTITSVADSLLRQKGYDVTCVDDGEQGYEIAKKERPDLIISGLGLLGITGIELCKKVCADPITGGIPVVLLVGEHDGAYMDQLDVCGARGRLRKPFSPKELLGVVEKYAGSDTPMHVTRIVDQNAEGAPRLQPSATNKPESQVGFPKEHRPQDEKVNTPFNLDWDDLKESESIKRESSGKINLDDTGLVIDDDQYGLTSYVDKYQSQARKQAQEDYNWFVDEMKRDISGQPEESKPAQKPKAVDNRPAPTPSVSYQDIGSGVSEDSGKYQRFLDQFKKDTGLLGQKDSGNLSEKDLNWIAEAVAQKLAAIIMDKISRDDIQMAVISALSNLKK